MKHSIYIASDTLTLLRRDKAFLPAIIISLFFGVFAVLAADWGIEEFDRIILDIGKLCFQLTGGLIAIFWGVKSISDSRSEGSLEVQLSSPISRVSWIFGKFLGVSSALVILGYSMFVTWSVALYLGGYSWLSTDYLLVFTFQILSWIIVSSFAIFFSSFMSSATSMFSVLCTWIIASVSSSIVGTLTEDTNAVTRFIIEKTQSLLDLSHFIIGSIEVYKGLVLPSSDTLIYSGLYGLAVISVLNGISMIIFQKRDIF